LKGLVENYHTFDIKNLVNESQVKISSELSDIFIQPNFQINTLKKYFDADADAWLSILDVYNSKVEMSKGGKCKNICYEPESIYCENCEQWFHWKCDNVSAYV
jgi:hypothetical protein